MPVRIITDSAAAVFAMPDVDVAAVLPMTVSAGERTFGDADVGAFNEFVREHPSSPPRLSTSQPSPMAVMDRLAETAATGDDVLMLTMSSKMSGTYDACCLAADVMAATKEGIGRLAVLDTTSNCLDEGFAVEAAVKAARDGAELEECIDAATSSVRRSRWLFTVANMDYLRAGGRIGKAAALAVNLLRISPILTVSDGQTDVKGKARLMPKALAKIETLLRRDVSEHGLQTLAVHYSGKEDEARRWAAEKLAPFAEMLGRDIPIASAPPVIAAHVGGAIGLVYRCEEALSGKVSSPRPNLHFAPSR